MKVVEAEAKLLTDIDKYKFYNLTSIMGNINYKNFERKSELDVEEFIKKSLRNGEDDFLEHLPHISFAITCDKAVAYEIMRYKLFSVAQEFSKNVIYTQNNRTGYMTFVVPSWFNYIDKKFLLTDYSKNKENAEEILTKSSYIWLKNMENAESAYISMLDISYEPEQARTILPMSVKTELVVTGNLKKWRNFIKLRLYKDSNSEIREITKQIYRKLKAELPAFINDISSGE